MALCWFRRCRFRDGELVELMPGKPRILCPTHREAVMKALDAPGVYVVHWGRTRDERIADAQARHDAAQARLRQFPPDADRDDPAFERADWEAVEASELLEHTCEEAGDPVVDVSVRKV